MARLARIVIPDVPHHVTQRGNRRQQVFFSEADYQAYLDLLMEFASKANTKILSYCLMPNHVHLVLVPADRDGLHATVQEAHRRYTRRVNLAHGWKGYLWQGRFASFPMDDAHAMASIRYVERNPVSANLTKRPEDWKWSSARGHLGREADELLSPHALIDSVTNWRKFLATDVSDEDAAAILSRETTGRPLGSENFVEQLEKLTGRTLKPQKRGRKRLNK